MEWSSVQQLGFVLKSVFLGCCIGCMLDISGGFWRGKQYRYKMYIADVICCILAAVITFFGALVITDGQLHPVLFIGISGGVLAEHFIVGRWLSLAVYKFRRFFNVLVSKLTLKCERFGRLIALVFSNAWLKGHKRGKNAKNSEKF